MRDTAPTAREAFVSDSIDPLSGLNGPSLFPLTIRASADVTMPAHPKDLDSIHNFMKYLEPRSPQNLMNEAKKIVDGGAELLESDLVSFGENMSVFNAIAVKCKDMPKERRPGLGLARKRDSFSLKTTTSQPSVNLEPTFDIDRLQDPDEFFDAYERIENARKEIQKQLGGSMNNINLYKPTNNEHRRRPGILGKSYNYKHRYSSTPAENDDTWMSSQGMVYQNVPSAPKNDSQEKLVHPESNPDDDMENVELAASIEKTQNEVNDILEELLSCNDEELEGDGALNLLQERFKIKPLDLENLCMIDPPDVATNNILTASEIWKKPHKSSGIIDSVLKSLSRRPRMEQELVANPINPVSSPTPPRSPFASISLLNKRILQPSPQIDPFSPLNIDKLPGQGDAPKDVGMSNELEVHVKLSNREPLISDMDAQKVMGNNDSLPEQFVDANTSTRKTNAYSRSNPSLNQPKDKLLGQVDALKDLGMSKGLESHVEIGNAECTISNRDAQEVMRYMDSLPEHSVEENASMRSPDTDNSPNQESEKNIGKMMSINANKPNHYVFEEEDRDDSSGGWQIDPEQPPEFQVHAAKLLRGKRVAGGKLCRNAHPMRKSLAEAGTSFETGVRRSKRIKSRPLEYWKGERFLYGCINDSLKLIGIKYISPGKGTDLKVKSYISLETPEFKELLDLACRH